jgi:N-acetylglucosamine malate deacetylase 1
MANKRILKKPTSATTPPLRVLAVGAHPDDVEIYCLGLLVQLQRLDWQVGWIVATDGQAGLTHATKADQRREEAICAAATIGVKPTLLGLTDGQLTGGERELKLLRQQVHKFAPNLIISHAPNDYHPDHRALSQMTTQICPLNCALIYADTMCGVDFLPEFSVDISAVFEQKMAALREHASQKPSAFLPHLTTWNRFRAMQTSRRDVQYAESYQVARALGRPSVFEMLRHLVL